MGEVLQFPLSKPAPSWPTDIRKEFQHLVATGMSSHDARRECDYLAEIRRNVEGETLLDRIDRVSAAGRLYEAKGKRPEAALFLQRLLEEMARQGCSNTEAKRFLDRLECSLQEADLELRQ